MSEEIYNERAVDVPGVSQKVTTDREAAAATKLSAIIKNRLAKKAAAAAAKKNGKGGGGNEDHQQRAMSSGSLSGPLEKGSMCNKFGMETESSSLSFGQLDEDEEDERTLRAERDEDDDKGEYEKMEGGTKRKRPPKIWISKTASMEHDDLD
jgi:hypothetical protein